MSAPGGCRHPHGKQTPPLEADNLPPGSRYPPPHGKQTQIRYRPIAKGKIEGDQIHAHSQGGNWGGSDPGPYPRGIRSRPTAKGEIEGDQIQAHSQEGHSGGSGPSPRAPPPPCSICVCAFFGLVFDLCRPIIENTNVQGKRSHLLPQDPFFTFDIKHKLRRYVWTRFKGWHWCSVWERRPYNVFRQSLSGTGTNIMSNASHWQYERDHIEITAQHKWDAYRQLVDRIPACTVAGGCTWEDVPAWGVYLPGRCTCPGGVPAWGCTCPGGGYLPRGVYLPRRGVPAQKGCTFLGGAPAQEPPPPVDRQTPVKT